MDGTPRRLWLVHDADRTLSVSYCPPASAAEVQAAYPRATVEPEDEPEPTRTLDPTDEARIRDWLASIGEHDDQTIDEVLAKCAANDEALAFFLARAKEVAP
jgi:hypothetical protein